MAEATAVPLANGKGFALIDTEDAELVAGYSWYRHSNGHGGFYARGYVRGSGRPQRKVYMHHLLASPGADHANGDGLDNRRSNLRPATGSQNQGNQGPRAGTSEFKGVSWCAPRAMWAAHIMTGYRSCWLGLFATEEEAAQAYDVAAGEAWGEFARLNLPKG